MATFITRFFQHLKSMLKGVSATAVQQPVPAIPYDENFKNTCVPMVAIVDVEGNITHYLPLASVNNGDGTATIRVTN